MFSASGPCGSSTSQPSKADFSHAQKCAKKLRFLIPSKVQTKTCKEMGHIVLKKNPSEKNMPPMGRAWKNGSFCSQNQINARNWRHLS